MAIGRISGPLLAQNLFRDDVPLAFYNRNSSTENPILYLDVTSGKIGIQNSAPSYELDVSGYVNAQNLRVVETTPGTGIGQIGLVVIQSGTISTVQGPLDIQPWGNDDINLRSNVTVFGNLHSTGNITAAGDIQFGNTATDVVIFEAEIRSDIIPERDNTFNIGAANAAWAAGYFEKLYTKVIESSTGTINIRPGSGLTEFTGDIKVNGTKPIGTAPVVTNILYVTEDGNDTNDGRAQDPSRACRTVSGAVKSPYYTPGTSIRVAPGQYLENNPILLQPYTSVLGSDLRTTIIEPINKTQDLFHVQSGCYLAGMQFANGRSGILPIENRVGFNRGAYCTAFPPQVGGQKIDIYHSPYIQNCTNQSGPWLKDGTLFIPNQTIQVPTAVGTASWDANTTTITVVVNTGTILVNDSINEGPQHTGFFDARTLALANKSFLQEQVVAYVDATFSTSTFVYNTATCIRDTGLIVDSVAIDLLQNSTSESVFAGLQYWQQLGYVSPVDQEITAVIAAVDYLKTASVLTVESYSGPAALSVFLLYDEILTILNAGNTIGITDNIISNGLASTDPGFNDAYDALLAAKGTITTDAVDWMNANYPGITYTTGTFVKDIGFIIDSVAFDMLHSGNKQSIKAGVYYYEYSSTATQVYNEIPQTVAAYNFIKSIIPSIIKSEVINLPYQTTVAQVTSASTATDVEASMLFEKIDIITSILRNGPEELLPSGFLPVKSSIDLVSSESPSVINAFNLLELNRAYIQAEVIAYLDQTQTGFNYSREKCYRDVGILVENISYDVVFGGNQKSVESGLAYFNGAISAISGQENQTVAAIDHLSELTKKVITNTTVTNAFVGKNPQVINTLLSDGDVAITGYENAYNIVASIINSGPSVAPAIVISAGPDSQLLSAEVLMQTNREFIQNDVISFIDNTYSTITYDQDKCFRDVGLIVNSLSLDLLYSTSSQSTFAGIQYWNQNTTTIIVSTSTTVAMFEYINSILPEIVLNQINSQRYSTSVQNVSLPAATSDEGVTLQTDVSLIIDIVLTGTENVTERIIQNSLYKEINHNVTQAYDILLANKQYIQDEAIAYIDATQNPGSIPGYNEADYRKNVGDVVDSIAFDLLYTGNRQAIQCAVSYYGYNNETAIPGETTATIAAFNFIKMMMSSIVTATPIVSPYQDTYRQIVDMPAGTVAQANVINSRVDIITGIISSGTTGIIQTPISLQASTVTNVINAAKIVEANKKFIQAETVEYVNQNFAFTYDKDVCRRDTGLLVDAVTYDTIIGGNTKSSEAGLSYYLGNNLVIKGESIQTIAAINRIKEISLNIIANEPVVASPGNTSTQIILPFYQGGSAAGDSIQRNFSIITSIILNGPSAAPQKFTGTSLFAKTGMNPNDTKLAHKIATVSNVGNVYTITLKRGDNGQPATTIGAGYNATLYFGVTSPYPLLDPKVPAEWQQRQVDAFGSMGGSLVDGSVVSARSPINSFVYDAYTQVAQGGRGIHITNNGYAQLVSVFTVFCSIGVQADNGGLGSITNSNSNFGDICLLAKGFGKREFSGTVYNPAFQADPFDPETNQYYPEGFYPNNANIKVFVPDQIYRPHIGLVMEIEPPTGYTNEQGFPGFITAATSVSTLSTGSLTITDIDTDDIAIGCTIHIRNFDNNETDDNGVRYVTSGTTVVDVGYRTVYLSQALTSGGGEPDVVNSFEIYFCGKSYYTVLSSTTSTTTSSNITTFGQRLIPEVQTVAELDLLTYLSGVVQQVITNTVVSLPESSTATQVFDISQNIGVSGQSEEFIAERFTIIKDVLNLGESSPYVATITKTGNVPAGASAAKNLIAMNYEFLAQLSIEYIDANYTIDYNRTKCARDIKLIARQIIYDIDTGGTYNSVYSGLSYWARPGTYHIVDLENQVRDPVLFPDGAIVNFYQRSYLSALGYTLEYVGAGITYGALPQVGTADPVQGKETVQLDNGKVFFTSTDQNGDFRIGPELVISQATGTLRGRTFTKSLFAELTPFILAVESGGA